MTTKEWKNLIDSKRDEIIKALEDAFSRSVQNPCLDYIVELNQNGNISVWYTSQNSVVQHESTYNGRSVEIARIGHYGREVYPTDEEIETEVMEEFPYLVKKYEQSHSECSLAEFVSSRCHDEYSEIEKEYQDWYIDFFKNDKANELLDAFLEKLEMQTY